MPPLGSCLNGTNSLRARVSSVVVDLKTPVKMDNFLESSLKMDAFNLFYKMPIILRPRFLDLNCRLRLVF